MRSLYTDQPLRFVSAKPTTSSDKAEREHDFPAVLLVQTELESGSYEQQSTVSHTYVSHQNLTVLIASNKQDWRLPLAILKLVKDFESAWMLTNFSRVNC